MRARSHAAHSGVPLGRPHACPLAALMGAPRGRSCACLLARGAHWRAPRALLCVPARRRRSWARPEGAPVRTRSHAAHSGVLRGRFCACLLARGANWRVTRCAPWGAPRALRACPLARGARWRAPKALLCVPVRTQRSWARPEGAPVRARSHAAPSGVPRGCFSACPLVRGAHWRALKAIPCAPAGTRRILARPEGDSVFARWHAAHPSAPRRPSRGCPLARGAHGHAPKAIPCARRFRAHEFRGSFEPRRFGAWKSRVAAPSGL